MPRASTKKPSKYAKIVEGLDKYPLIDPEREEVIEYVKQQVLNPAPRVTTDDETISENILNMIDHYIDDVYKIQLTALQGPKHATAIAQVYARVRKVIDKLTAWDFQLSVLAEAYYVILIPQMEAEKMESYRMTNGQLLTTWSEPYATVDDVGAFKAWVKKQGLEGSYGIHHSTLNSWVKKLREDGEEDPDGVKVWSKTKLKLSKEN